MATTIGRVEFNVGADGRILEPELRRIGRRAGVAGGREAGDGFNRSFGQRLRERFPQFTQFAERLGQRMGRALGPAFDRVRGPIERMNNAIANARTRFERFRRTANNPKVFDNLGIALRNGLGSLDEFGRGSDNAGKKVDGFEKKTGKSMRLLRGHLARTIAGWTALVLAIGQGTATLGSGVGASLTALISSIAVAANTLGVLAGTAVAGFAVQVTLAVSAIQRMKDVVPGMQGAVDALGDAWQTAGEKVARIWGPSVIRLLETVTGMLSNDALLSGMGKSLASITDAFDQVFNGKGFQMLMKALETTIPEALANLGSGVASLTGGLASVFAAASPVLLKFSKQFDQFWGDWSKRMEEAAADGSLTEFFDKAYDSLESVLKLAGALGSALSTLFQAGADTGNSMLDTLTRLVEQWDTWMQTVEGQAVLEEWFANGEKIFNALLELAGELGTMLADLVTPETVERLVSFIEGLGDFLPIAGEILDFFGRLDVLNIFVGLLNMIGTFLEPLMPVLDEFASLIGEELLNGILELTPEMINLGKSFLPLLEALLELIGPILPPLVDVIVGVIDIIGEWSNMIYTLNGDIDGSGRVAITFGDIIGSVFGFIGRTIGTVLTVAGGSLKIIAALMRGDTSGAFKELEKTVSKVFDLMGVDFDDFKKGVGLVGDFAERALGLAETAVRGFGGVVGTVFGGVIGWLQDAVSWFNTLFGAANNAANAASNARAQGGGGGGTPRLSRFAAGGVLNGPRRILAGEAGREAIVPLNRALSQVDPSVRWLSAMAQGKYSPMASGGTVGGGRSVEVAAGAVQVIDRSGDSRRTANEVVNRIVERVAG